MSDDHAQVMTSQGFEVDEGMVALLELVWEQEIETDLSCQGTEGRAWISFSTIEDARKFVSLAVPQPSLLPPQEDAIDTDSLYNRAYRLWETGDGGDKDWIKQKGWLWDTFLENASYDPIDEGDLLTDRFSCGIPQPIFTVILRFPAEDISLLETNLARLCAKV